MKIIKSIASVGVFTILSRVAGFVREAVMAALIGVGPVVDALSIAIKLPSTFRRLLAEGAFNAVFVPMFSSIVSADGPEKARTWAVEILSFFESISFWMSDDDLSAKLIVTTKATQKIYCTICLRILNKWSDYQGQPHLMFGWRGQVCTV